MQPQDCTDTLLNRLVQGDRAAFKEIYRQYWQGLYKLAARKVREDIAEELVQDVFVNLWKNRENAQIQNLTSYLFSAIRFGVLNHYKREIIEKKYIAHALTNTHDVDDSTDYDVMLADLTQRIDEALRLLPEKTQMIFNMSRNQWLPVKEIAAQMALSEKAVEYHITQALRTLKEHLSDYHFSLLLFLIIFQK